MPYSGPFSLITGGLLGQDNPRDDIAAWANEQQRKNRAAVGLDANGNPLPANWNPATPAPPDPNQQTAAVTGQALANGQLPPAQEPQATKTPDSLGALLMNLTQYQMREQGFNKAMGMGFAAVSQPRDREMVSKMFDVNEPDVAATGQMEMNAATQQQGQDRMNSLGALITGTQGKAIADRLNISQAELIARYRADPQGVGTMIQQFASPTDQMKNLQQITYYTDLAGKLPGVNKDDIAAIKNGILANIPGPDAYAMTAAQIAWRQAHPNTPPPWNVNDPASFKQYQANEAQKEDDRGKASAILGTSDNTMRELQGHVANLQNNPGLMSILNSPSQMTKQAAINAMNDPSNAWAVAAKASGYLDQAQINAISELRLINSGQYASALQSMRGIASRPAASEVQGVADAMGQTKSIDMDGNTYVKQAIEPLLTKIKYARANAWGATGSFHGMDSDLNPYVHANYLPNGDLAKEGSGADEIAKTINKPLPQSAVDKAVTQMKADYSEKERVIDTYRQAGFDVSTLERLTPDKLSKM